MGQCADMLLTVEGPRGVLTLIQEIGVISCVGVAREDHRSVTRTGVEQLARVSFDLLCTKSPEIGFAARKIRESMEFVAKLTMGLPDAPLQNVHSACLAPFYSSTSTQALIVRLSDLANAVTEAPLESPQASS